MSEQTEVKQRGKQRKNEATLKNEKLQYEQKVTWTYKTDPVSWSLEALQKVLFGGLSSWVRQYIKRELDKQVPAVALYNRMVPKMKKMEKGEKAIIDNFLKEMAGTGFGLKDRLDDSFVISEELVLGADEVEDDETEADNGNN